MPLHDVLNCDGCQHACILLKEVDAEVQAQHLPYTHATKISHHVHLKATAGTVISACVIYRTHANMTSLMLALTILLQRPWQLPLMLFLCRHNGLRCQLTGLLGLAAGRITVCRSAISRPWLNWRRKACQGRLPRSWLAWHVP